MIIDIHRFVSDSDSTIGRLNIDGLFECFTIEDEFRVDKVPAETRIPAGTYEVGVRDVGGFHSRYSKKFPGLHQGMLEIKDVPGFTYILFHIGNTDEHTAGCILVGTGAIADPDGFSITSSTAAYRRFYLKVINHAIAGDLVVNIFDEDR